MFGHVLFRVIFRNVLCVLFGRTVRCDFADGSVKQKTRCLMPAFGTVKPEVI